MILLLFGYDLTFEKRTTKTSTNFFVNLFDFKPTGRTKLDRTVSEELSAFVREYTVLIEYQSADGSRDITNKLQLESVKIVVKRDYPKLMKYRNVPM